MMSLEKISESSPESSNTDFELAELKIWLEALQNPYIEIVHTDDALLELFQLRGDGVEARKARQIQGLAKMGVAHFLMDDLGKNIPDIPKDKTIVVGGGDLEMCVQWRVKELRKAGFKDVRAVEYISFSETDAMHRKKFPNHQTGDHKFL